MGVNYERSIPSVGTEPFTRGMNRGLSRRLPLRASVRLPLRLFRPTADLYCFPIPDVAAS